MKIIFLVLIAAYVLNCGLHPCEMIYLSRAEAKTEYHFIDGVNLLFHEAGHPIFGLFGNEFLMVACGTLGQLIMPLIIVIYFFFTGRRYSVVTNMRKIGRLSHIPHVPTLKLT